MTRTPADPAYQRWVTVSGQALDDTACAGPGNARVLEVIGAASAAMAELHDEIARLERDKARRPHSSQDWPWRPPDPPPPQVQYDAIIGLEAGRRGSGRRPARVRQYENRPGPLRGRRGVRAHLDPVTPPPPPGTPPSADYQAIYRLACSSALYAGIAEETLNLLDELGRHPGNRVLVMTRAGELRTRLDGLDEQNLGT